MNRFIPLPAGRPHELESLVPEANAGLLYEKYVDAWEPQLLRTGTASGASKSRDKEVFRARFHNRFVQPASATDRGESRGVGKNEELRDFLGRRHRLLAQLGGQVLFGKTVWRFVTGLGGTHPLETGFSWHRTLGVPYLPGSSVKGMMRAYLHHWLGEGALADELFGSVDPELPAFGLGKVIVFDALPTEPVRLNVDIINPHYPDYYRDETGKTHPSDDQMPTPVTFLTVAPGQRFEFALAPTERRGRSSHLEGTIELLKKAAATIGAGAKTSVGYGLFQISEPRAQEDPVKKLHATAREKILEQVSEFAQHMLPVQELLAKFKADPDEQRRVPNPDPMMNLFRRLDDFTDEEQLQAAKLLNEIWHLMAVFPARRSAKKARAREEKIQQILARETNK